MLKSRRGLLAAGISAVVIGTIGVTSTLNAGAEEIPASPVPVVVPAPVEEEAVPESTPPALLPWGEEPEDIRTGQDGASSAALKASGSDAAAPDASGEGAEEEYAPKGFSAGEGVLDPETTGAVPPAPPGMNTKSAAAAGLVYHYNALQQEAVTQGTYGNLTIHKPELAKEDYHTLAELAVVYTKDEISQAVEVGWTVDRAVNGDDDPHLFVFSWVDGKPRCYNGCGFMQYSANIRPGDTLPLDTNKRFGIEFHDGAWWIAYASEWIGYFPATDWTIDFSTTTMVKHYGEVASVAEVTCTDMGSGVAGTNGTDAVSVTAARLGSISLINGPALALVQFLQPATKSPYTVAELSSRTFRYGGPGTGKCASS